MPKNKQDIAKDIQTPKKIRNELFEEAVPFQEFFPKIEEIKEGVIIQEGYWYSIVALVSPMNYYLLDEEKQDKFDKNFESWLAQQDNTSLRIYVQNRLVNLTENIEHIFYLIYDYQVNTSDNRLDDGENFEKQAMKSAKTELLRKLSIAQSQLHEIGNDIIRLSTEEIIVLLYQQFNRKDSLQNQFNEIS